MFVFHHFHQVVLAAGIQHPVSDAALVPRHGINEDCEAKEETGGGGGGLKQEEQNNTAGRCCPSERTCGLEVVALVGMFVEEDVVARHVCGDPQRQLFQLRRLGAAQPNQLLLMVDLLSVEHREKGPFLNAIT